MQLQEICHKELSTILARSSETLPNYLADNIYCEDNRRCVLNSTFVAWINEEILDLGFLNRMSANPMVSRLVRSEIRYTVNNSQKYQQNAQTINEFITFKEKYREFKIGAVFHNQQITQFDMIDCHLVCLSSQGKVTLIDLEKKLTKEVIAQTDNKSNTSEDSSRYVRLLLSRNQPSLCYALTNQLQLSCISFTDGSIFFNLNLLNAGFLLRSLELKQRLVVLPDNDLLVISANKSISLLDRITGKITSCVHSDELVDNFVISQLETDLFLIHSNASFLLFLKKHNLPQESRIFNFELLDQQQLSNLSQSSKLTAYIQQFSSQTTLYKRLKETFSFNLWKILQDSSDNFCFYFRSYILSKLLDFLSAKDIPLKEWIRLAIILSIKRKPKELSMFIELINALVIEEKIKKNINNYLWEFLPLFDYERGELEDSYKQSYVQAAKLLNRTQELKNYMH